MVLNGAPRAGKSSIAAVLERDHGWSVRGVDWSRSVTPEADQPGIGLRPGGEHPELEPRVAALYQGLWSEVVRLAGNGDDVVVDVGLHRSYATGIDPWAIAAAGLNGHHVWLVGVRCGMDEIVRRRSLVAGYATVGDDGQAAAPVLAWQAAVHEPGSYDLEVDTETATPAEAAGAVLAHVAITPPQAFPPPAFSPTA